MVSFFCFWLRCVDSHAEQKKKHSFRVLVPGESGLLLRLLHVVSETVKREPSLLANTVFNKTNTAKAFIVCLWHSRASAKKKIAFLRGTEIG